MKTPKTPLVATGGKAPPSKFLPVEPTATRKEMFTPRGGNPFTQGAPPDAPDAAPASNTGSRTASMGKFKTSMGKT